MALDPLICTMWLRVAGLRKSWASPKSIRKTWLDNSPIPNTKLSGLTSRWTYCRSCNDSRIESLDKHKHKHKRMNVSKEEKYHLRCIIEYSIGVDRRSSYPLECFTKAIEDNDIIWSFPPVPVHLRDPRESWNSLINAVSFELESWATSSFNATSRLLLMSFPK